MAEGVDVSIRPPSPALLYSPLMTNHDSSILRIDLPMEEIASFCRRWKIVELSVFGSVLRDDFRPDSDIDFLASFAEDAGWSVMDLVAAEDELSRLLGRKVDLAERRPIEQSHNWIRRRAILDSGADALCRVIMPHCSMWRRPVGDSCTFPTKLPG